MATWVIGDIHGCWQTLQRLLDRIRWSPEQDPLWLVGDLVNRGPQSLEVLRWAHQHRDRLIVVLGNHDLHLLARAADVATRKRTERLDDVLAASDRDELLAWLAGRPLVHRQGRFVLVHAGLLPGWSADEAAALADEISSRLAGGRGEELLAAGTRNRWSRDLGETDRLMTALTVFTRVRTVREDGRLCLGFTGTPGMAPDGCRPWFSLSPVPGPSSTVIFGHWASLGLFTRTGLVCIDSGCVYGGFLSAYRLDDGQVVQEPNADGWAPG